MVRLRVIDSRDKILEGHFFFDNKPVIVNLWTIDMDIEKEDFKTLPIWVQLKLHLKYWGEKSLHKIVSRLGDPIKRDDEATENKDKI